MDYKHTPHAGNEGDVFKHFMLAALLTHYIQDTDRIWYMETHAGAGLYTLPDGLGQAIFRVPPHAIPAANLPAFNKARGGWGTLNQERYPGSPMIADSLLRSQDRMTLFETSGPDFGRLGEVVVRKNLGIHMEDGFMGVPRALGAPDAEDGDCEAVIFIDPDYHNDGDWDHVLSTVGEIVSLRPGSTIIVWYPTFREYPRKRIGDRKAFRTALNNLLDGQDDSFLWQEINTHGPAETSMNGAGLCILNARPGTQEGLTSALLSGLKAYRGGKGNLGRGAA